MTSVAGRVVKRLSNAVMLVAGGAIAGWFFDVPVLVSVVPGLIGMNPLTAIAFMLVASWQKLALREVGPRARSAAMMVVSCAVFAAGAANVLDFITGSAIDADRMFFAERLGQSTMSQLSACCFTFLGSAMMLRTLRLLRGNAVLFFVGPVFTLALLSFFAYVIARSDVVIDKSLKPMAVNTSFCFFFLVVSFLVLFPENSITTILTRRDHGGYMARRLLPYVILVPLGVAFVRYHGERLGYYDSGFGVGIFLVLAVVTFMFVVVKQCMALSELDRRRKKADDDLRERSIMLEKANYELTRRSEDLAQFAHVASHDMQEPLRKLNLFSNLMWQDFHERLGEGGRTYLDRITSSTRRLNAIIHDLLHYSYQTADRRQFVHADLGHILMAVEEDLQLLMLEKGAVLKRDPLPTVPCVPAQMHRVFYNLLTNALKFGRPGVPPVISVTATIRERTTTSLPYDRILVIRVADNGVGFEPENAERIFHLFTRLHDGTHHPGTGIGLSLCRKVIANHAGRIYAEGRRGEGATFIIELPL